MRTTRQPWSLAAAGILIAVATVAIFAAVSATADDKSPQTTADEAAIRASVESYVAAYNRGDAKAVAAHWSDTAEWVAPSGKRVQGRAAIEKEMQAMLAESKGLRIEVSNPSVRVVAPDAAVEEGSVRVFRPGQPPSESTYLAVHVKKGGKWQLDSVRETETPETPAANAALGELSWLVGQWVDDSPQANAEVNIAWTKNKTFLTYSFKVSAPGMDDLEGTQVIGYDPAERTIRSWMFDSDGGFGEGVWSKKGDGWVVKSTQTLPDGRKASATNIYTLKDPNTLTWKSVGRKVDGKFLPNVDEVKMVRKIAAAPSADAKAAAKPAKK